ncbi:DUF1905 domain-containing protein [Kribbella qitaiheensis]|uniref:DUF1905 domain-containing protein n=1 Tax=Kribbella qitaiheensis TaxID=1544730 RepID=UPI001FE42C75|nr:DUF1905 domain-containing protein [Kribbella qitaiheensis]
MTITVNGHCWRSRVAILRGRHLLGLSNAAGVAIGDEVEVELVLRHPLPAVIRILAVTWLHRILHVERTPLPISA